MLKVCLLQVYSNPLFLAEGALPPTQLNKLSDSATVADSTAEGSTAIASLQIHQDAACASAAGSASGLESEQAADNGSTPEAASLLCTGLALTADTALLTAKSAEQTSASESGSQLQTDQATASQSASGLQREQDSVIGPSAELPARLQDQQDSGCAAAASSASTSGRHVQAACKLPGNFTPCSQVHTALSALQANMASPCRWAALSAWRHCSVADAASQDALHICCPVNALQVCMHLDSCCVE